MSKCFGYSRPGLFFAGVVIACAIIVGPVSNVHADRRDERSKEMFLPDPVLDPSWPILQHIPGEGGEPVRRPDADGRDEYEEYEAYMKQLQLEAVDRYIIENRGSSDPNVPLIPDPLFNDELDALPSEDAIDGAYSDPREW